MNAEHLNELRELRKQGLTKLCIQGSGCEFVVDERVQNKISHDLIRQKQELSEFLDLSQDKPGLCHLYKANFMVNIKYLLPEELKDYRQKEQNALNTCDETTLKPVDG